VINFDNKLKGLESNPDYPKEKPWYFRPGKDTAADYNILSNIPLTEHHFNHPDKRPPPEEEKVIIYSIIIVLEIKNQKTNYNWIKRLQYYYRQILRVS